MAQGQWIHPAGEQGFWFDAGADALDFVYSAPFVTAFGTFTVLETTDAWLTARFPAIDGDVGPRELVDAEALRAAIGELTVAIADGHELPTDAIDALNLYAATPDVPPVLAGSTRQAGRARIRPGQALSTLAREAVRIFGEGERERIRRCSADDCELVFFDDSRAGARRWCSMQRCGNRAKVRTYRARAAHPTPVVE